MESSCVIAGKVFEDDGDAVAGVSVRVQAQGSGAIHGTAVTNDLGEFRITGLQKGEYVIVAQLISERMPARNETSEPKRYAPTYYPGTTDITEAMPVRVHPGEEKQLQLGLIASQLFHVRGTISGLLSIGKGHDSEPNHHFSLSLEPLANSVRQVSSTSVGQDGVFDIAGLLPGRYRASIEDVGESGGEPVNLQPIIEITNSNIEGLALEPIPEGEVHGQFRVEGGRRMDWSNFSIILTPLRNDNPGEMLFSKTASDGSFTMRNVPADDYEVTVNTAESALNEYFVRDLKLDGRNYPNWRLHVTGVHTVEVTMSPHGANIQGVLLDESNQPLTDAQVICLPEADGDRTRPDDARQVMTDRKGHFKVQGLSPGQYKILGLDDEIEDPFRSEFLQQLSGAGSIVKLEEGEHKTIVVPATHVP